MLGTFDDFILTSLSLQQNGTEFLEKKQSERKQILSQFMDVDIFDKLYEIAKEDSNEERILLKRFLKKDSYAELAVTEKKLKKLQDKEKNLASEFERTSTLISELEDEKLKTVKKLWKIEKWEGNVSDLEDQLVKKKSALATLEEKQIQDREYKETLRPLYLKYYEKMNFLDENIINVNYQDYITNSKNLEVKRGKLDVIDTEMESYLSTLQELEKYLYDRDCEYCVKNGSEHIKHKRSIREKLQQSNKEKQELSREIANIELQLHSLENSIEQKEEYDRLTDELNQISQDAIKVGGKITTVEETIKHFQTQIQDTEIEIKTYYELEEKIKTNKAINDQIELLEIQLREEHQKENVLSEEHKVAHTSCAVMEKEKEKIESDIQQLIEIEQKILDHDLYMLAMSRDGISYELIGKTILSIEAEINEVLDNMMVGFTIKLVMDGKNIDTLICYGDETWSLDLASGMERFVCNLAIRVGLINVSTLPRPNFLCIDEGFGTLDSESIVNMEGAFNYLKTQFDFVLIITHLDAIKDYVDHLIPIDVTDGFSQIVYV